MPVVDDSRNGTTSYQSWPLPPKFGVGPTSWSSDVLAVKKVFSRPDSVSTLIGDGWREPTGYWWRDINRKVWSGSQVSVGQYYDGSLNRYENFQQRFTNGPIRESDADPIFKALSETPGAVPYNLVARCQTEALLKARNDYMQLGASLAEGRKTLNGLADTVVALYSAFRAAKRGDLKALAKALSINHRWSNSPAVPGGRFSRGLNKATREMAGRWLEVQYAWLPLLSDLKAGYDAIAGNSAQELGFSMFVTKRLKDTDSSSSTFEYANWLSTIKTEHEFECFVRLDYLLEVSAFRQLDRFGLLNPVSVAWELVPFSFVVDWLLPIGDLLAACGPMPGLTFRGGSRTERVLTTRKATASVIETDVTKLSPGSACAGSMTSECTILFGTRVVYENSPFPLPYIKNPFSVGHGLNALALMRQLLK